MNFDSAGDGIVTYYGISLCEVGGRYGTEILDMFRLFMRMNNIIDKYLMPN